MMNLVRRYIKFNPLDPFNLLYKLSEEQILIYQTARDYAQNILKPRITQLNRTQTPDQFCFQQMGRLGFLGCIHKDFHLPQVSYNAYGLIIRALDQVDNTYGTNLSVTTSLVMLPILEYGSQSIKQKVIPDLSEGKKIGCYCLTEPNAGSNPAGMTSKAIKKGSSYILSGSKTWITNSPIADVFVVWAKNQQGEINGFILQRGMPGLQTTVIHGKLGLRASSTGTVMMDQVQVPQQNKLDVSGLRGPLSCLNSSRFGVVWGAIGAAEACLERTLSYVQQRVQFNTPLAQKQLIQKRLTTMVTEISLTSLGAYHLGKLKDKKAESPELVNMMKYKASIMALDIARQCRDILGGNGMIDEYDVIRHMLNLQVLKTYEGSADIHALLVGKATTGYSAFQ